VSQYQKSKTNLAFTKATDSEGQWHQLGRMQVCTSLQTDNQASTPPLSFLLAGFPFRPPSQQCQCTEGSNDKISAVTICKEAQHGEIQVQTGVHNATTSSVNS